MCDDECVQKYRDYYRPTAAKIECLELETQTQRDSFLWHTQKKVASQAQLCTKCCTVESTDPTTLVSKIMGYSTTDLSSNKAVNWGIKHESVALDEYHDKHSSEHQNISVLGSGLLIDKVVVFWVHLQPDAVVCSECGRGVASASISEVFV